MSKPTIVVPTYWGAEGKQNYLHEKVVFDHPTPLDSSGTLPAFFDSLSVLKDQNFSVAVIAVPNSDMVVQRVIDKVNTIIEPYKDKYDISVLHPENLQHLKHKLQDSGLSSDALKLLNLSNYAAVRNMCSLAGILNSSELTIFIDDDEVFHDPDFMEKAHTFAGREWEGEYIHAVAGYYLQPNSYKIENKNPPDWTKPQWDKIDSMNRAFDKIIGRPPRLKITPFVFGGNMVIDLETLMNVPFDPNITRGEDIDFLINLRIAGINFYLDNELAIRHLPPPSHRPEWKNLREDVKRFLYEKKKLDDHKDLPGLQPEDFNPYPGIFLQDDLHERIIETAKKLREKYIQLKDETGINECSKIIAMVENNPFSEIDTKAWLHQVTINWQELTRAVKRIKLV